MELLNLGEVVILFWGVIFSHSWIASFVEILLAEFPRGYLMSLELTEVSKDNDLMSLN